MPEAVLAHLRKDVGKRIRLEWCSDPYTELAGGDEGTITFIDDFGTVHVNWDSGSTLGLIYGEDHFEVLSATV